jgi:peroxiredoxin
LKALNLKAFIKKGFIFILRLWKSSAGLLNLKARIMNAVKFKQTLLIIFITSFFIIPVKAFSNTKVRSLDILKVGNPLPDAKLKAYGNLDIEINDLKGKIKIISIVPRLNTPVCDKQTHQFSEANGGLDKNIDIITLSTNTTEDQLQFSQKTKINNLTFLSDFPRFIFGKKKRDCLLMDWMYYATQLLLPIKII